MMPVDLIQHAARLLMAPASDEADRRRAVSAAYYAVFNALTIAAAEAMGPDVPPELKNRIRRTFGHTEILKVCKTYLSSGPHIYDFVAQPVGQELVEVCEGFRDLIDAREKADYDLSSGGVPKDAAATLRRSVRCVGLWQSIQGTPEAQTFVATLLLYGRRRG